MGLVHLNSVPLAYLNPEQFAREQDEDSIMIVDTEGTDQSVMSKEAGHEPCRRTMDQERHTDTLELDEGH